MGNGNLTHCLRVQCACLALVSWPARGLTKDCQSVSALPAVNAPSGQEPSGLIGTQPCWRVVPCTRVAATVSSHCAHEWRLLKRSVTPKASARPRTKCVRCHTVTRGRCQYLSGDLDKSHVVNHMNAEDARAALIAMLKGDFASAPMRVDDKDRMIKYLQSNEVVHRVIKAQIQQEENNPWIGGWKCDLKRHTFHKTVPWSNVHAYIPWGKFKMNARGVWEAKIEGVGMADLHH